MATTIRMERPTALKSVMRLRFPALISRLQKKLGWSKKDAEGVFEDTKRFLYLCAVANDKGPFAPTERIDECWHNFLLFTEEYAGFCQDHFGRFIHHRPRSPGTKADGGKMIHRTLEAAREHFGRELSENWVYPVAQDCAGSTNCQSNCCNDGGGGS